MAVPPRPTTLNCTGGSDPIGMLPNQRPLGAARQNHEGDPSRFQVLLVSNAPIGREQQVEGGFLSGDNSPLLSVGQFERSAVSPCIRCAMIRV